MRTVKFHGYTIYEDGKILRHSGREMKKAINNGRYEIRLTIDGKRRSFLVARLIYHVFYDFDISNKDLCIVVKDGDNLNIHLRNLELKHRKDLIHGEKHTKRAKLTNEQVEEIRRLYSGGSGTNQFDKVGYSMQDLGEKYGVTKGNIWHIIHGYSRAKDNYKL